MLVDRPDLVRDGNVQPVNRKVERESMKPPLTLIGWNSSR